VPPDGHCGAGPCDADPFRSGRQRRAVTLVELLIAMAVMSIICGALGMLATTVYTASEYGEGNSTANQHGRVVIERIERIVRQAVANEDHPGIAVLSDRVGSWTFPDTLIVWTVDTNDDNLPQMRELVVFCPDPSQPQELLELTDPNDTTTVSLRDEDASSLRTAVDRLRQSPGKRVLLTELVRVAKVGVQWRAAVRFHRELRPSGADWQAYKSGSTAWEQLPWVQDIKGSSFGLRQSWVRFELQLMPSHSDVDGDVSGQETLILFGSAALYYQMQRG
jgi:prepilin-type N-terminal cleavage/methylation domain-containing protein